MLDHHIGYQLIILNIAVQYRSLPDKGITEARLNLKISCQAILNDAYCFSKLALNSHEVWSKY